MANYMLADEEFKSRAELERLLTAGRDDKGHLDPVEDPYLELLLGLLLERHPEAEAKIGAGVSHWVVFENSVDTLYTSTGYRPMRVDGTGPIKFSYMDVLKEPTPKALFQEALTLEAIHVTLDFRLRAFDSGPVPCARNRCVITHHKGARAEHLSPSRRVLHDNFLASRGIDFTQVELVKHPRESGFRLVDRELAGIWVQYQKDNLDGMGITCAKGCSQSDT